MREADLAAWRSGQRHTIPDRGPVKRSLVAFVALVIAAAACAPTGEPPPSATGAPRGGTATFAIWQEPETLNPFYGTQTVSTLVNEITVEGLLQVDVDGNRVPQLAAQVPTLPNGQVKLSSDGKKMDVTYTLKSSVLWSDGKPFTSADVKFTWQAIMRDPKVTSREGYDKIDSIDTPNDTTVVIHYQEIYAPFATRFGAILPKHVLESFEDMSKSDYGRKPVGTGPFVVTEFAAGDHITAERNPNYRVKDKPLLDRIIFKSVPSSEVAIAQLRAGEVDGMWNILEAQLPDLEKDPNLRFSISVAPDIERLVFNLSKRADPGDPKVPHPVLGDIAMRHALLLATPKQQIIDKLLFGKVKAATSPLSQGWAVPKDLTQEGYDPAKAKQLLDQAGWVPGPDGIRAKSGNRAKLEINTTTGNKTREQTEQILVDEWKNIGVELTIKNYPSSVLFGSWKQNGPRKKGNYDVYLYTTSASIDPHNHLNQHFNCANIPQPSNNGAGFNYWRFCSAAVDALLDKAGSTVDEAERAKAYAQVLRILNDNYLSVWLYTRSNIEGFRANVGGYRGNTWDNITSSAEDWFVRR